MSYVYLKTPYNHIMMYSQCWTYLLVKCICWLIESKYLCIQSFLLKIRSVSLGTARAVSSHVGLTSLAQLMVEKTVSG